MNIGLLKTIPVFDRLEERSINALAGVMQEQRFDSGAIIIEQGSPSDGIHIVLDGNIQISRITEVGAIVVLNVLDPGAVFGTLSTIDKGVRGAQCIAKTDVITAFLGAADFEELMEGTSTLALGFQVAILRSVFSDIRKTNEQLAELSSLEAYYGLNPI